MTDAEPRGSDEDLEPEAPELECLIFALRDVRAIQAEFAYELLALSERISQSCGAFDRLVDVLETQRKKDA